MSTKTWQEEFDKFVEEKHITFVHEENLYIDSERTKQFISDLRKHDEDELIKIIKEEEKLDGEIFWGNGNEKIRDIIKDYYAK